MESDKDKINKRSLCGRSLCSVRLFQSVVPPSIPQSRQLRQKRPLKNKKHIFGVVSFLIFTRSLPAFVGATASATPHHFATLRKLSSAAFCRVHVCRPLCFQRLLLRTAIGVGTAPITSYVS